jgi:hypothetical protein
MAGKAHGDCVICDVCFAQLTGHGTMTSPAQASIAALNGAPVA